MMIKIGNKIFKQFIVLSSVLLSVIILSSCNNGNPSANLDEKYLSELMNERAEKDSSMQFDIYSPFKRDTSVNYSPLKYFEPDGDFIFKSKLYRNDPPDTVFVLGTKGETRTVILIGQVHLDYKGNIYPVNVYKGFSANGQPYYSIWFTDKTTGKETYGVGRYLDIDIFDDPEYVYTIDFNRAYNPYCAYTKLYTCPIPREEDYIDISIEAGEKNFH